jgi:hypothetical protein
MALFYHNFIEIQAKYMQAENQSHPLDNSPHWSYNSSHQKQALTGTFPAGWLREGASLG